MLSHAALYAALWIDAGIYHNVKVVGIHVSVYEHFEVSMEKW